MREFRLGLLVGVPASARPDLLSGVTGAALTSLNWLDLVGVVEIDPAVSDTTSSREEFELPPEALANCVVVAGRRQGEERRAACVVLSSTRADVNGLVRRYLDVHKASFLPAEHAVAVTGMEYGGITPLGLPESWPVLIDRRVGYADMVVLGSGVRRSKLLMPGSLLASMPGAEVVDGLGR